MSNSPIDMLNTLVDVEYFNKLLENKGGRAIKTSDNKIVMRDFIKKLIKTFRKDFMKKTKKGGMAELYTNESETAFSFRYGDLDFKPFTFSPLLQLERDLL